MADNTLKNIPVTAIIARRAIPALIGRLQETLDDPEMTSVLLGAAIAGDSYVVTTQVRKLGKPDVVIGKLEEPAQDSGGDQSTDGNSDA